MWKWVWRAAAAEPSRTAVAAVFVLALIVSLALNLPGHMSYDSVLQLTQGRAGVYNNWHPPVMAWLLGLFDGMVRGTGLFVLFDSLLLFGALLALALASPRTTWLAAALALLWVLSPDGLIYPGIVWKDVLFAAASTAGFAVLAVLPRAWPRRRLRFGLIAAAFVLLSLGALARQNGFVILPAAAAALGWIAVRCSARSALHTALAYSLSPLVGAVALVLGATAALQAHGDGEPSTAYQMEDLQTYDLAAALRLDPALKLDHLAAESPRLEQLMRARAAAAYTPERLDPITSMPALQAALIEIPMEAMSDQWRDLVLRHTLLYLRVRIVDFAWVFFTPRIEACLPYFVGVDGPSAWVQRLGMKNGERPQDVALRDYGDLWIHTPLASHAVYGLLGGAALIFLLRRRRPADIAVAGLVTSALLFTATFFLISVACDYRYLYFLDVAAIGASLYVAADGIEGARWLRRRSPPPGAR